MLKSQEKGIEALKKIQDYDYRLDNYTASLSEITFRAYKSGDQSHSYRITFQTTLYIQATPAWNQGDFQLATPQQHLELAKALELSDAQREQLLLFVARPVNRPEVLILCHTVFVSQEIPAA